MRKEGGWAAAAALGVAAAVGVSSFQSSPSAPQHTKTGAAASLSSALPSNERGIENGPCAEFELRLQAFFSTRPAAVAAPDSCYPGGRRPREAALAAVPLQQRASDLQFIVATLPDPLHTHFSLIFDRATEAVQQAAQDEGYLYDSSWLPWDTDVPAYAQLRDNDEAEKRRQAQEDQPGLLLFRARLPHASDPRAEPLEPYRRGLAVLLVGEEPTGGLHQEQFLNAIHWIDALQPARALSANRAAGSGGNPVSMLGPSFSGSLPSLVKLLAEPEVAQVLRSDDPGGLRIYSGGVSSAAGARWLQSQAEVAPLDALRIHFKSFEQSGNEAQDRYCAFLHQSGTAVARLAVLSEDETAFGSDPVLPGKPTLQHCLPQPGDIDRGQPTYLYYPRDISALRAAYQSQSIFNQAPAESAADTGRRILQNDLADPEGKDHDTIRSYSGDHTALSQEAELQQIVSMLRAHRSEYILLRSSNPLDQLFLSHFLRMAYPAGRIVISGADLLLRRETGASGLNGIMTLSTYPLLPWEQDWTKPATIHSLHSHRLFTNNAAEGSYVAARLLLHPLAATQWLDPDAIFVPALCDRSGSGLSFDLRDYSSPFWLTAADPTPCRRPPTWLSVLGNGGFWPVASLGVDGEQRTRGLVARTGRALSSAWASAGFLLGVRPGDGSAANAVYRWDGMSLSMKLSMAAVLAWAVFHALCCARGSITVKPSHRAYFVRSGCRHQLLLIVLASVTITLAATTLAWGCGAMSSGGEPLRSPWFSRLFLFCVWALGGFAVAANVWVETILPNADLAPELKQPEKVIRRCAWRALRFPLGAYLVACALVYLIFDFALDCALSDANRIPTYLRAMNLGTGISPLMPLLLLTAGLYGWLWYALEGASFFGRNQPLLPPAEDLRTQVSGGGQRNFLHMLSAEELARPLEQVCAPFPRVFLQAAAVSFIVVLGAVQLLSSDTPIRSLGSIDYSILYGLWLTLSISLLLATAYQLAQVWLHLRPLLLFLDKLPLRATLRRIDGFSWGSVWRMSGNVLDVRDKLLFLQIETLNQLSGSLDPSASESAARWVSLLEATRAPRVEFACWYAGNWQDWRVRNLETLATVQNLLAKVAAVFLTEYLVPEWRHAVPDPTRKEAGGDSGEGEEQPGDDHGSEQRKTSIFYAEQLVCLVYISFIQNILGRMRTYAAGMAALFIAIAISVSSYPFDPRTLLSGAVITLFVLSGMIIITIYSQMHRDATLSHLTNTKPGELGSEFWLKLLGFGAGPVLGLLASIFPGLTDFFVSWLQPGMSAIK